MANRSSKAYKVGKGVRTVAYEAPKSAASSTVSAAGTGSDQGIIVMSALVVFGLGLINTIAVKGQSPGAKQFMAPGFVFLLIFGMAEFNSKLAKDFALLVLVTAFIVEGSPVLQWFMKRSSQPAQASASSAAPTLPQSLTTGPAATVSTPGTVNMFTAPFSAFPAVPDPFRPVK